MAILLRGLLRALGARIGTLLDVVGSLGVLVLVIERVRDVGDTTHGLTTVEVKATRWPAWAGVVLAVVLAAAALVVLGQYVVDHLRPWIRHVHAPSAT